MALNRRLGELIVTCDNAQIAQQLDDAAKAHAKRLKVFVDIDPGLGRTGIRPTEGAVALVEQIASADGLEFGGLQCYAGQVQHMESPNERRARSLEAMKELGELCDALRARGIAPKTLSGGGTGTFDIDPDANVLTELQVGSYVFMDRQYNDVWEKSGGKAPFEVSLSVQTTVVSANRDGLATTDAGLKAFATDADAPKFCLARQTGQIIFSSATSRAGCFTRQAGANCGRKMFWPAWYRTAIPRLISMIATMRCAATYWRRSGRWTDVDVPPRSRFPGTMEF